MKLYFNGDLIKEECLKNNQIKTYLKELPKNYITINLRKNG